MKNKMAAFGICKLCLQQKELIGKSHVIPAFMYKGMEDELNRYHMQHTTGDITRKWMQQKTLFDKYILCADCDNAILGSLDRYASLVIGGGIPLTFENRIGPDGIRSVFVSGLDYKKYKLFALSILWRAHISTNVFFKQVNIPAEAERIRKYLLHNEAPPATEFKTMVFILMDGEKSRMKLVGNPRFHEEENKGEKFCAFVINGYMYMINLAHQDAAFFRKVYLKEDGTIEMPVFFPPDSWNFLIAYFGMQR